MASKVIMPKQGLQMTEGTIISWLIKEGQKAVKDEPLFEMETDKLTITIDSPESGTLLKVVKGEGETVPITETIGIIGEQGEDISGLLQETPQTEEKAVEEKAETQDVNQATETKKADVPKGDGTRIFISPRAKTLALDKGIDIGDIKASGPDGLVIERDVKAYIESAPKATPLARKVAQQKEVALGDVQGSGARGKIGKEDVLAHVTARKKGAGDRTGTVIPFAGMRKVIASRMVESLQTAAQATHRIKVDMTEAGRLRNAFKSADKKVSYNDIVATAVCRTLKDYPIMNSELTDKGILIKDYVNLGIAVAIDNGLIVPVINDADLMTVEEIGTMTRELAVKAKNGKLKPNEYKGGSFTISNLGMFGLDSFTAIINQPESGILAVGKIEKTPVVVNDEIAIRPIMALTLTYDHRVVDGAPAAQFLAALKKYLEQPYLLL